MPPVAKRSTSRPASSRPIRLSHAGRLLLRVHAAYQPESVIVQPSRPRPVSSLPLVRCRIPTPRRSLPRVCLLRAVPCSPDNAPRRVTLQPDACRCVCRHHQVAVLVVGVFLPRAVMVRHGADTPPGVVLVGGASSSGPFHAHGLPGTVACVVARHAVKAPFRADLPGLVADEAVRVAPFVHHVRQPLHPVVQEPDLTLSLHTGGETSKGVAHPYVAVRVPCLGHAVVGVISQLHGVAVMGVHAVTRPSASYSKRSGRSRGECSAVTCPLRS